ANRNLCNHCTVDVALLQLVLLCLNETCNLLQEFQSCDLTGECALQGLQLQHHVIKLARCRHIGSDFGPSIPQAPFVMLYFCNRME
ncbi:hypothetical protein L9F63_022353, partial [Diploptera punctata]